MIYGMDEDLLTLEEAASIAHVSAETVRYWIKVKRINKHPIRISARSGKPYGVRVKRGELLSSLTDSKLREIENEIDDDLLTAGQIASRLSLRPDTVRAIIRKLKPTRYYVHNDREYFTPFKELLNLMQDDDWYCAEYQMYRLRHKDMTHSCEFCK